jgi:hypothetical protein
MMGDVDKNFEISEDMRLLREYIIKLGLFIYFSISKVS